MTQKLIAYTQTIKEIIVKSLELDIEPEDIEDEEILFGEHLELDSISMMKLIVAIEKVFNIEVEDEDLTPELIESVSSLARYVEQRIT